MTVLPPGRGTAPVEGGHVAFFVEGKGPPVASAHPYTTPRAGFGELPGLTTISVWPRGFGASSPVRNREDFGFWRLSEDLDAVRRHLGLERWVFWGTSMGGFTALVYGLDYQDTLAGLILDSTADSYRYRDDPDSIWPSIRQTPQSAAYYGSPSWATFDAFFTEIIRSQGAPDPAAAWASRKEEWDWNPGALAEILRRMAEFDTRPRLGELRLPCLILQGARDLQCPPSQGRNLAERIPDAQYEFFPGTGHGVLQPGRPDTEAADWQRALEVAVAFVDRAYAQAAASGTGLTTR